MSTELLVSVGRRVVVTGPPGAGQSAVAGILAKRARRSVLVDGDACFGFLTSGAIQPWLREVNDQNDVVIQAAASAAGTYAAGGYETIDDGVGGPWFLPTFLVLQRRIKRRIRAHPVHGYFCPTHREGKQG